MMFEGDLHFLNLVGRVYFEKGSGAIYWRRKEEHGRRTCDAVFIAHLRMATHCPELVLLEVGDARILP